MSTLSTNEVQVRKLIVQQAADWFVANRAGLAAQQREGFATWLKTSPLHVEEYLTVSVIARDLRDACAASESSVEALVARARAEEGNWVEPRRPRILAALRNILSSRWQAAAVTMAAFGVVCLGLLWRWDLKPLVPLAAPPAPTALHFETRHGEQQTYRLADNSVLHLNTASAITVRYSPTQRLAILTAGEAEFETVHDPARAFRVLAGPADVVDLGTRFNVRLEPHSAVVTVVEGRVAVGRATNTENSGAAPPNDLAGFVQLGANEQLSVSSEGEPGTPVTVNAEQPTSWLHRQIVFDHEPLERVAAEFNRYTPKPIEIAAPALRSLKISGVFTTDDTKAFVAFLRTLPGVRVEETATRIRVSQR